MASFYGNGDEVRAVQQLPPRVWNEIADFDAAIKYKQGGRVYEAVVHVTLHRGPREEIGYSTKTNHMHNITPLGVYRGRTSADEVREKILAKIAADSLKLPATCRVVDGDNLVSKVLDKI